MDDAQAEQLVSKAALVASDPTDVRERYQAALSSYAASQHQLDKRYLDLAPTFLDLHKQASSSADLLDSLQAFLSTFQSDLSTLSSHISSLQNTSHAIDARLDARRQVETDLASFLSEITISPRIVDLFFDTEPDNRLELWHKAVRTLERVIDATNKLNKLPTQSASTSPDSQALTEARNLADTCKNVVAAKLRNYLLSPYTAIKSSVTTNLQVLQTSILLKHHRPFYAFLARQMPRVAIDVQRNYVAAARLYFETAFRRYARSLGTIKARWTESPFPLITDAPGTSSKSLGAGAAAMAFLSRTASTLQGTSAARDPNSSSDPWLLDSSRLEHARLDGPSMVLGYQSDDVAFRAPPEALFRSIALVLVDNACSEYAFLLRFFELPASSDETASSVVALTADEMAHRGASDEIFRQIFEPAISNFTAFIKTLLSPPPGPLALVSILSLNEALLALVAQRGCQAPALEAALMRVKLDAFPLLKRALDDQVDALRRTGPGTDISLVATRYAAFFSRVTALLDDEAVEHSLLRIRAHVERLAKTTPEATRALLKTLETGPAATSHPRIQAELSHWTELERTM